MEGRTSRVQTQSSPPDDDCGDSDGGGEVPGELVVAGGDPAPVLQAAEAAFDQVPATIGSLVVGDRGLARARGGDDGFRSGCGETVAQVPRVVALVGDQADRRRFLVQQGGCGRDVGVVRGGEGEGDRSAASICQRVDFRAGTTARAPDGLNFRPPFPPWAERCARTAVESMLSSSGNSALAASAAKMRVHSPRWLQRLKRL